MPAKLTKTEATLIDEWHEASRLAANIMGADKADRDPLAHTCLTQLLYKFRTKDY